MYKGVKISIVLKVSFYIYYIFAFHKIRIFEHVTKRVWTEVTLGHDLNKPFGVCQTKMLNVQERSKKKKNIELVHVVISRNRSSHWWCSLRKSVLRNKIKFTGKHLCQSLFFNKVAGSCNVIKNEALAQVFSCEFCEISKNKFFTERKSYLSFWSRI